jgi:hypothetical protein
MAKRKMDGVRRMLVQAYVDQNIPFNAAKNNMSNAEFIEFLYKKAKSDNVPDEMPLEEKRALYVELDRKVRALGVIIQEEKEKQEIERLAAEKELEAQKNAAAEADKQKEARQDYNSWWRALPVERTKALLQEREIALAKVPMNEQAGLRDLFKRQWEELWRKETA